MRSRNWSWSKSPFTLHRARRTSGRLGGTVSRENPLAEPVEGVRITDKDSGLIYEATVETSDGEVRLTALTILTTRPGQRIDQATMRSIPVQFLAEQVADHLDSSRGVPTFTTGSVNEDRPDRRIGTLEEVAESFKQGGTRQQMAARIGISLSVWDKRVREARDTPGIDLPEPRTGRKRGPKNS